MYKVLLDSGKYLLSYSTFLNPLESDVYHMTSQILLILIDFTQTSVPLFRSFFKSLDLYKSGTRKILRNGNGNVPDYLKGFQMEQ